MSFLTVIGAKDVENIQASGLVGLSPAPSSVGDLKNPMTRGVAGFLAQLKDSKDYNYEFEEMFSIYLTNDQKSPGKITFGGYDTARFAKQGLTDKDVFWTDQSRNEQYWASNNKKVSIGDGKKEVVLTQRNQQVIFDNGMTFGSAPEQTFVKLAETLLRDYGVTCMKDEPLYDCRCTPEQMAKLPSIKFEIFAASGASKQIELPPSGYMMAAPENPGHAFLLLTPTAKFEGVGKAEGEEYWILGAQFLQNYYTIYDFAKKKIGLVESVSS